MNQLMRRLIIHIFLLTTFIHIDIAIGAEIEVDRKPNEKIIKGIVKHLKTNEFSSYKVVIYYCSKEEGKCKLWKNIGKIKKIEAEDKGTWEISIDTNKLSKDNDIYIILVDNSSLKKLPKNIKNITEIEVKDKIIY
jgi:hypothetical protein